MTSTGASTRSLATQAAGDKMAGILRHPLRSKSSLVSVHMLQMRRDCGRPHKQMFFRIGHDFCGASLPILEACGDDTGFGLPRPTDLAVPRSEVLSMLKRFWPLLVAYLQLARASAASRGSYAKRLQCIVRRREMGAWSGTCWAVLSQESSKQLRLQDPRS